MVWWFWHYFFIAKYNVCLWRRNTIMFPNKTTLSQHTFVYLLAAETESQSTTIATLPNLININVKDRPDRESRQGKNQKERSRSQSKSTAACYEKAWSHSPFLSLLFSLSFLRSHELFLSISRWMRWPLGCPQAITLFVIMCLSNLLLSTEKQAFILHFFHEGYFLVQASNKRTHR